MKYQGNVIFKNKKISIILKPHLSILKNLLLHKISIDHSCGGYGTCGTCRFNTPTPHLILPPNEIEELFWHERGSYHENLRLSCQSFLNPKNKSPEDILIIIP